MELRQKKSDEEIFTEAEQLRYQKIIEKSHLPLFKFITDLDNNTTEHHENFYLFFIEKSDFSKQIEKTGTLTQLQIKQISNYEMKNRSIHKQPIRIQLLVNAILKGSTGDKQVSKQYAFSKLFNSMKNNHVMQFLGEGFFDLYYISIYKCRVPDQILDHLFKKMVYICKESETVLLFKNESLSLKQEQFQDFFIPQDEGFRYYSVSDYLKKSTSKLYEKCRYFLEHHNNNSPNNQNQRIYDNIFADLEDDITPDLKEKLEYDKKIAENPRYKLEICHYYLKNSCAHKMNSVKCKFAHGEIEMRTDQFNNSFSNSNINNNYNCGSNNNNQTSSQSKSSKRDSQHEYGDEEYGDDEEDENSSNNNNGNAQTQQRDQKFNLNSVDDLNSEDNKQIKHPEISNNNKQQYQPKKQNSGSSSNNKIQEHGNSNNNQNNKRRQDEKTTDKGNTNSDDNYNSDSFFASDSSDGEEDQSINQNKDSDDENNKQNKSNNENNTQQESEQYKKYFFESDSEDLSMFCQQ